MKNENLTLAYDFIQAEKDGLMHGWEVKNYLSEIADKMDISYEELLTLLV